jgi:hypothetical protein
VVAGSIYTTTKNIADAAVAVAIAAVAIAAVAIAVAAPHLDLFSVPCLAGEQGR